MKRLSEQRAEKFCMKCGSKNLKIAPEYWKLLFEGKYICGDCGFEGVPLERTEKPKKGRRKK